MIDDSNKLKPKISVVIPVYNARRYLPQCLDSILSQTLQDIEVICVDDGSTDDSQVILNNYQQKDCRIHVFIQKNSGAGPARNCAIQHSSGEFVAFMDADDWYPEVDILEILYVAAKEHDVKICGGSFSLWDGETYSTVFYGFQNNQTFSSNHLVNYFDYQYAYGFTRFIYCLEWLRNNNLSFPNYSRGEDPPFFVESMLKAKYFYALNKITYCYRVDHKKIIWDSKKNNDVLTSLIYLLQLSNKYKLNILHKETILRYNSFCLRIALTNQHQTNPELLSLIKKANGLIDISVLIGENPSLFKKILKPYLRFIYIPDMSNMCTRLFTLIKSISISGYWWFKNQGIKHFFKSRL